MKTIVGIDPGKSGFLVCLSDQGLIQGKLPMPLIGKTEIDCVKISEWIAQYEPSHIVLEKAQSFPTDMGKVSVFNYGKGYGELTAVIKLAKIPFTLVRPMQWQKTAFFGVDAKLKPKQKALVAAKRLFPDESFLPTPRCKVPSPDFIDATLIALWGLKLIQPQPSFALS